MGIYVLTPCISQTTQRIDPGQVAFEFRKVDQVASILGHTSERKRSLIILS